MITACVGITIWVLGVPGISHHLQRFIDGMESLGHWGALLFILVYVAATVILIPGSILTLGAGAAQGGGPLMDPRGVEFGDKHIDVACGGDVAGPKINCPAESSSGVHVAGTIHRHPPVGTVATGAAEGGRTPIRITTGTSTPRLNRRPPPNHNNQRQHTGRNE